MNKKKATHSYYTRLSAIKIDKPNSIHCHNFLVEFFTFSPLLRTFSHQITLKLIFNYTFNELLLRYSNKFLFIFFEMIKKSIFLVCVKITIKISAIKFDVWEKMSTKALSS